MYVLVLFLTLNVNKRRSDTKQKRMKVLSQTFSYKIKTTSFYIDKYSPIRKL